MARPDSNRTPDRKRADVERRCARAMKRGHVPTRAGNRAQAR